MTSTPQRFDYSIPPSPLFPPVPRVSPASSVSSLNSLYEFDGQRLQTSLYDSYEDSTRERQPYYSMSKGIGFTDDEIARAFQDRIQDKSYVSAGSSPTGRLAHDVSDPQSPWKRSIRLKYSDVNMRDTNANTLALQEASELLSRDMASYVNSEDESVEKGSPLSKISPAVASATLNARLQEALEAMEKSKESESEGQNK